MADEQLLFPLYRDPVVVEQPPQVQSAWKPKTPKRTPKKEQQKLPLRGK